MNKQLTKNFNLSEFTGTKNVTEYQISLLQILANNLQIARDSAQQFVKKGCISVVFKINNSVRYTDDVARLKAQGYNPSTTSDHFCGLQTICKPTIGAADVGILNASISLRELTAFFIDMDMKGLINFGQIIYEMGSASGWIHFGNSPKLVFQEGIYCPRTKYLMSLDNGKTYIPFSKV